MNPRAKVQQNHSLCSQPTLSLNSSPTVNNSSDLLHKELPYQRQPNTIKGYVLDAANTFSISTDTLIKATAVKRSQTEKLLKINSCTCGNVTGIANLPSAFPKDNVNSRLPFRRIAFAKKKRITAKESACTKTISNNTVSHVNTKTTNKTQKQFSKPPLIQPIPLSYYSSRMSTLFLMGLLIALIIDHLLIQAKFAAYPNNIVDLIDTAILIPPICGFAAVLVGTLFPMADYLCAQRPEEFQCDWCSVIRCTGGFIGVAYAATKFSWYSNPQVSLTLALISVVLWFLFDRTIHGFLMSLLFSSVGTGVMYVLVSNGIYSFDFFGVRPWIPCVLYSSCVCFGTLGRHLMVVPEPWFEQREQESKKRGQKIYY